MRRRLERIAAAMPWPWARWRHRELDRRLGELRWYVEMLSEQVAQTTVAVEAARSAAEEARSLAAGFQDTVRRELALQHERLADQLTDHTDGQARLVQDDVVRRLADVTAQVHAAQLNQLALSHPGDPTVRLASSSQPSLPLHRLANASLSFMPTTGVHPTRVAVVSLPKAGTYLMAEVLTALGWVNTHVHAWAFGLHDYRDLSIRQIITDYLAHHVALPIDASAPLVQPGQFWVGHFEVALCREALRDFLKVFMIRDLRFALVSYMRWLSNPGRGGAAADAWRQLPDTQEKFLPFFESHGRQYVGWCREIVGWLDVPEACLIRFEDITGLGGEAKMTAAMSALASRLGATDATVGQAIRQSLGQATKTYSGRYSTLEGIWSTRIEDAFAAAGGRELNALLGYPADPPALA
jgi:hypothetical protein